MSHIIQTRKRTVFVSQFEWCRPCGEDMLEVTYAHSSRDLSELIVDAIICLCGQSVAVRIPRTKKAQQ